MQYTCDFCVNKNYKTDAGLWKHNNKYHQDKINEDKIKEFKHNKFFICEYCNKQYKHYQSRWNHEQKCKDIHKIPMVDKINKLSAEITELKLKPQNIINNTTNIQYIVKAIGHENICHLSFDKQREIMKKGLNSLTYLIELNNFNNNLPENHSYCVTSLNGPHASVIDVTTNKVIKTDKIDLFDKILISNLKNLETVSNNENFTNTERCEYKEKLDNLKNILFQNRKGIKRYYKEINLISYNNKDIILETWASLKSLDKIIESETNHNKLIGFDDLADDYDGDSISESDIDSESDGETIIRAHKIKKQYESLKNNETNDDNIDIIEITIKNIKYILEGTNIYNIINNKKANLYGTYLDGKIKKNNNQNTEIYL